MLCLGMELRAQGVHRRGGWVGGWGVGAAVYEAWNLVQKNSIVWGSSIGSQSVLLGEDGLRALGLRRYNH